MVAKRAAAALFLGATLCALPAYAEYTAPSAALSRDYQKQLSSDVFFGAAIGSFVSKGAYKKEAPDKAPEQKKEARNVSVVPEIDKNVKGLSVKYRF